MTDVLAVVGARLNSSRLPGKQLLDLAGRPLIAHLFERLERVEGLDRVLLATTADDYNRPLVKWAERNGKAVFAYAGDVNDLVGRVDAAVRREDPRIVIYVCGDSPLVEPQTLARMIAALSAEADADGVGLVPAPAGHAYIHEGFQVYSRAGWARMVDAARTAQEREHVGLALRNMAPRFIAVDEAAIFWRRQHRLSVDTQADYRFMSEVYRRWYATHGPESIVSLPWLVEELERDPALASINSHVRQKGADERSLRVLLVTACGPQVGLGHLRRAARLARALQEVAKSDVRLLVRGAPVHRAELALLRCRFAESDFAAALDAESVGAELVLFDLPKGREAIAGDRLRALRAAGARVVGVDCLTGSWPLLDRLHLPSFHLPAALARCVEAGVCRYGWDAYLLEPPPAHGGWRPGPLLVYLGGGDPCGLGRWLPAALMAAVPPETEVVWVRGPFAEAPLLPVGATRWTRVDAPESLIETARDCSHALAVYGVGAFELLQAGLATVLFSPYPESDPAELAALAAQEIAWVADDARSAPARVAALLADEHAARRLAARAAQAVIPGGAERFAAELFALVRSG